MWGLSILLTHTSWLSGLNKQPFQKTGTRPCLNVVQKDNHYSQVGKAMTISNNLTLNHGDLKKSQDPIVRYFLPLTTFQFQNSNHSANCLLNVPDEVFLALAKGTWEVSILSLCHFTTHTLGGGPDTSVRTWQK